MIFLLYSVLLVSMYSYYRRHLPIFTNGPINPFDDLPTRICPHVLSCVSNDGETNNSTNDEKERLDIEDIMKRINSIADELNLPIFDATKKPQDFLKNIRKPEQAKIDRQGDVIEPKIKQTKVVEKSNIDRNVLPMKLKRNVKDFQGMDMHIDHPIELIEMEKINENLYKHSLLDKLMDQKYSMLEKLYYIHEFEELFGRSLQIKHDNIQKSKTGPNLHEGGLLKDWEFMI